MKRILLQVAAFFIIAAVMPGCGGLQIWQKGMYFRSDIADDFSERNIRKVGIVVLSNGRITQGFVSEYSYPPAIHADTKFRPDTMATGPSLELAKAIGSEFESRIYASKIIEHTGHSREISVKECIEFAKNEQCDAVLIVTYTGFNTWTLSKSSGFSFYPSSPLLGGTKTGFLYIPNAAMFDCTKGDRIWHNTNYGIVEAAHLPNIHPSGSFVEFVPEAFTDTGAETYIKAAPQTAAIMFKPPFWQKSFAEIPPRGEKRKKL